MTNKKRLINSIFDRNFSFHTIWLDFWFCCTVIIGFIGSIIIFQNPIKFTIQLFGIRQFLVGNISIMEVGNYSTDMVIISKK